jgi:hypothetical protein
VVGKSFSLADTSVLATLDSATKVANENCGWNVTR